MAKKALNRAKELLTNKWVLLAIFAVSIMLLIGFAIHRNIFGIVIFALVVFLTSFFSRNMTVILLISIAVTGWIIGIYPGSEMNEGFSFNEGFESKEEDDEDADDEDVDDDKKTPDLKKGKDDKKSKETTVPKKEKDDKKSKETTVPNKEKDDKKSKGSDDKESKGPSPSKKKSGMSDSEKNFMDKMDDYKEKMKQSVGIDIYKNSKEKLNKLSEYMNFSKKTDSDEDADK